MEPGNEELQGRPDAARSARNSSCRSRMHSRCWRCRSHRSWSCTHVRTGGASWLGQQRRGGSLAWELSQRVGQASMCLSSWEAVQGRDATCSGSQGAHPALSSGPTGHAGQVQRRCRCRMSGHEATGRQSRMGQQQQLMEGQSMKGPAGKASFTAAVRYFCSESSARRLAPCTHQIGSCPAHTAMHALLQHNHPMQPYSAALCVPLSHAARATTRCRPVALSTHKNTKKQRACSPIQVNHTTSPLRTE